MNPKPNYLDCLPSLLLKKGHETNEMKPEIIRNHGVLPTRWAPTSYKLVYKPYKWPKINGFARGDITLLYKDCASVYKNRRGPTLYQNVVIPIVCLL